MRQTNKKRSFGKHRKSSFLEVNFDKQILALHVAMVDKLLANPSLIEQVKEQLEQRNQAGRIRYSEYINWFSIIDLFEQPETFKKEVLQDTPFMRKCRRNTPLVGIITESERQEALNSSGINL